MPILPELHTVREVAVSRRVLTPPPARTLEDAVRLCDPFTPLDPREDASLHEDLNAIRGGNRLDKIVRNIRRTGGISTIHFLGGHVGGGKTTELLRMRQSLELAEQGTPAATVLFLDADTMLDRADVELEDILVALWGLLYEQAPDAAAAVLAPIWKGQIKEVLKGTITNLPEEVAKAIGNVLGQVQLPSLEQRHKIRSALGSVLPLLVEGLNRAFHVLMSKPPNDGAGALCVLIDNLEKLSKGQRANVERLYQERMVALKGLNAHLVITVPLYLCYAASGAGLVGLYGGEIVVLPMIEVRLPAAKGGGDCAAGLSAMSHLLKRRVRFDLLFEEGDVAVERIARLSGGVIRHALRMVQSAVNEHNAPPVTLASVEWAIASVQADFERALPEAYVPILKEIAQINDFPTSCTEDAKRDLLLNLFVLEYQNGEPEPWYAVHPLVERLRKYRRA